MAEKIERTKIKICGLSRPCDIDYVNEAMPDYCGFIINCPKSIRNVSLEQVRALVKNLNPGITPVGVFVNEPVENILSAIRDGLFVHVQLHGKEDDTYIKQLREQADREITIIKAYSITDEMSVNEAKKSNADYILLDHGAGGTGHSFDWDLIKNMTRLFFLAGGLNPDNLPNAIEQVHPWAVDVSSGVETDGKKDREKILAAVNAI